MTDRERKKLRSHRRIVEVAAEDIRTYGLGATGVKAIMQRAGLTHGGFYNHFPDKTAMIEEAFRLACEYRDDWLADLPAKPSPSDRLQVLAERYLTREHRDQPGTGCPFPSLAAEIARESKMIRSVFEHEINETIRRISEEVAFDDGESADRALALLALCVGALTLSRAVVDADLANRILAAASRAAPALQESRSNGAFTVK
ncbi:TetR/AcrR family transcriptional regulator [Marinivivus vitaminiproducens]|uniref:TetR/AcrR family transcriptional regulator n=1 Tax=Marinivivus vitaminiproducens TaxID=3035935 RepID=UPI0027A542F4|nr:TetR/AcrR family transcriptional regulator [Geminicoccaceae bacterium SCSIO 64248]